MREEDYFQNVAMTGGQGYAPPLSMPSERADLLDKIKPSKIVEEVRHKLLGENEVKGVWIQDPRLKDFALSYKGAWEISTLMLSVSSQNVSLSKLTNDEIRKRALAISKTALIMCLRNWKDYNIRGTDQLWFVNSIVFSNTFITLKQPEGAGLRNMLTNFDAGGMVPQPQEVPTKQGLLGGLFRR